MTERRTLPVIPLRSAVVFPGVTVPIAVGREASLRAVEAATKSDGRIFAVAQRKNEERPDPSDLYTIGVIAKIGEIQTAQGGVHLLLEGETRATAIDYRPADDCLRVVCLPVSEVPPPDPDDPAFKALHEELRAQALAFGQARGVPEPMLKRVAQAVREPGAFVDLVAGYLELPVDEKQALLEMTVVEERMRKVLVLIQRALEQHQAREAIQSQVKQELGDRQREIYLREQMKAIQKELGDGSGDDEIAPLRERLLKLPLPDEARVEVKRELGRLERTARESAEAQVIRSYLEWIADLPWGTRTEDSLDVRAAEAVLESDHYGLEDVKDRVMEFLAVRQLQAVAAKKNAAMDGAEPKAEPASEGSGGLGADRAGSDDARGGEARSIAKGPILLFIGPPGVGKTSIGKSIARALGRKYVRLSLGGVRDEADIRGHRRTYVGAMPGRIVQALKQAGTKNPVILLDEVDKLAVSYQGNPAAALLEVLDPAQNHTFTDHYLNVPFDLSEVLFVATANFVQGIPGPLLDRMEVVEFAGYTEREKREIAKRYLVPRQFKDAGIAGRHIELADEAVALLVSHYTREAGVRQLERQVGAVARKLARKLAAGETVAPTIEPDLVRDMLGRPRVRPEKAAEHDEVGLATGMYYTPAGGDIMFVEASIRRLRDFTRADTSLQVQGWSNISLILTGQLGDVMKESARAALTYAAAHAEHFGIPDERVGSIEVHLHVPAGAIPKDGPSAGAAMATALVSAMSGRPVRRELAMTGEITLRGRVLPIGGVKEKVLGAVRAGIEHVVLPADNEADLDDLPEEVRKTLRVSLVRTLDDVFALALREPEAATTRAGAAPDPGLHVATVSAPHAH